MVRLAHLSARAVGTLASRDRGDYTLALGTRAFFASEGIVSARYVVKAELAAGGMGVVYRVHDRTTGEARALKRIQPDVARDPFHVAAFEREYQVLAGLDHPRIIRVFDYGVDEIGPYYTMELLEGDDMRHAAPLPFRSACGYLRDVATSRR